MTYARVPSGDEVDLFEVFEMLWDGKWLIAAFVASALVAGAAYTQLATVKYRVSGFYVKNFYSVAAQQRCGPNQACLDNETVKQVLQMAGNDWEAKGLNSISLLTTSPLSVTEYADFFHKIEKGMNETVLKDAKTEFSWIQTELKGPPLGSERVATNLLNAKRVIGKIDSGEMAVEFGKPSIVKVSPKSASILAWSAVLGGLLGALFTLLRRFVHWRKAQAQVA